MPLSRCSSMANPEKSGNSGFWFFLQGIGSVWEIFPQMTYLPEEETREAIQRDWEIIGADLWTAVFKLSRPSTGPTAPA